MKLRAILMHNNIDLNIANAINTIKQNINY